MRGLVTVTPGECLSINSLDELRKVANELENSIMTRRFVHAVLTMCGLDEYAPSKICQIAERRGVDASVRYVDGCVIVVVDATSRSFARFVKELAGMVEHYKGEDKV